MGGIVEVEFGIAAAGFVLVENGWVEPLGEQRCPRGVRRLEDDGVGRGQRGRGEVDRIASGSMGDRGPFGLRLVEEGQRSAAGPAEEHDLAIGE